MLRCRERAERYGYAQGAVAARLPHRNMERGKYMQAIESSASEPVRGALL